MLRVPRSLPISRRPLQGGFQRPSTLSTQCLARRYHAHTSTAAHEPEYHSHRLFMAISVLGVVAGISWANSRSITMDVFPQPWKAAENRIAFQKLIVEYLKTEASEFSFPLKIQEVRGTNPHASGLLQKLGLEQADFAVYAVAAAYDRTPCEMIFFVNISADQLDSLVGENLFALCALQQLYWDAMRAGARKYDVASSERGLSPLVVLGKYTMHAWYDKNDGTITLFEPEDGQSVGLMFHPGRQTEAYIKAKTSLPMPRFRFVDQEDGTSKMLMVSNQDMEAVAGKEQSWRWWK